LIQSSEIRHKIVNKGLKGKKVKKKGKAIPVTDREGP
jgi:hypothetical protein